ncbi:S8 family serine peptidase [Dactylosporangium sp. CA-092794]|uniref:S8 family serine peptidase n=1 Tax=Dactylosporangium sp. CA-092794 TaxID=3239929 RepID=UPI003D8F52FA
MAAHRTVLAGAAALGLTLGALVAVTPAAAAGSAPVPAHDAGSALWHADAWSNAGGSGLTATDIGTAYSAQAGGADGTGVGIALIDTGVVNVPGLPAAQIVNGPDLSFESQSNNLRYLDTFGHGTHLAGIMVGSDPATGFRGIAPKAKLTSIKVGASGGAVDVSQVIAAIDWAVEHRGDDPANPIRVINLAYGTDGTQITLYDPLNYAVENAWRNGIVVVAAGGNAGATASLTNPAYDPFVLAVGSNSVNNTVAATDDTASSFNSRSTSRNIDLTAPGEQIVSLRDPGSYLDTTYPGARVGDAYFRGSGTSQASAVATGAVALLLQKRPTLTPDQVKAVLKATATPIAGGAGELNLAAAVKAATPSTAQTGTPSAGVGSLETARGTNHVVHDNQPLIGEYDIFGPFNPAVWAQTTRGGNAWVGGVWMGRRMAGDGWTGTSWASKTWAAATWSGQSWAAEAWYDDTWSGHYWSGGSWTGHYWSGHYWSSSSWSAQRWT